ncbi:MAG: hypothetical protein M3167_00305 [Acidobacteriota bacterium]|nr:hypothetical protein [Acidobacteriota bacterium]
MDKVPLTPYDFLGYLASGVVLVAGMDLILGFPHVIDANLTGFQTAALLLLLYAAGHLIATPAKTILEDRLTAKGLGPPARTLLATKKPRIRSLLFPGYYAPLPTWARDAVRDKAGGKHGDELFLFIRFTPAILESQNLQGRLAIFLNQYGFCRNLSFTSLLVGAALLLAPLAGMPPRMNTTKYAILLLVGGVLLFYRFLKFYRQYSAELLLTYARTPAQP